MQSLLYGLMAALAWGLHDFCVRHLSRKVAPAAMLLGVMLTGSLALGLLAGLQGAFGALGGAPLAFAGLSGAAYAMACFGLYNAFAIGPVRLVAPICGAYPVLSFALAAAQGQPIELTQWLAALAVVAGIALVARQEETGGEAAGRGRAMAWGVMGAVGFALTFALGQIAAREGGEAQVTLISRLVAVAIIGAWVLGTRVPLAPLRPHWRLVVFMGVVDVTALGLVFAAGALPNPEFAAVASSIFGLITILLAWRFLHEPMRALQWGGVGVVFGGIAWLAAG